MLGAMKVYTTLVLLAIMGSFVANANLLTLNEWIEDILRLRWRNKTLVSCERSTQVVSTYIHCTMTSILYPNSIVGRKPKKRSKYSSPLEYFLKVRFV